jgi:hypothetical protein
VGTASEIRKQLEREGYDGRQVEGPALMKQLTEEAKKARGVAKH